MTRRGGSADDRSSEGGELPVEENDLNRFLRQRKRQNVDSTYHPTHDRKAVAKIPQLHRGEPPDTDDREEQLMELPLDEIDDRDFARLKQGTSHLPDDVALKVLNHYEYDIETTIMVARQMAAPEKMPEPIKHFFVANIATEKDLNPSKKLSWKEFYFENMLTKCVDTKTLVDFYYREKNKIGGNWRMEHDDQVETPEETALLEQKMTDAGIEVITRDPAVIRQEIRSRRPQPTRHSTRTRRSELERLLDKSDSESTSGTPDPTDSTNHTSQPSTSTDVPRINLRFRFNPSLLGTPQSNISIITTPRGDDQPSTSSNNVNGGTPDSPKRRYSTRLSIDEKQQLRNGIASQLNGKLKADRKRKTPT